MDKTKRAVRRAHTHRLKTKRSKYWNAGYWFVQHDLVTDRARRVGMTYRTPKACSCWLCGNRRKRWGVSIQEIKQKAIWETTGFLEREDYMSNGVLANIEVGHWIEVESDAGFADNGPWCSRVIERVEPDGFKVDYDDGATVYKPSESNYVRTFVSPRRNTIHVFSK